MLDVRTPIIWNKPKTKIYDYNQQFTSSMYQVGYFIRDRVYPFVDFQDFYPNFPSNKNI